VRIADYRRNADLVSNLNCPAATTVMIPVPSVGLPASHCQALPDQPPRPPTRDLSETTASGGSDVEGRPVTGAAPSPNSPVGVDLPLELDSRAQVRKSVNRRCRHPAVHWPSGVERRKRLLREGGGDVRKWRWPGRVLCRRSRVFLSTRDEAATLTAELRDASLTQEQAAAALAAPLSLRISVRAPIRC
jgi:hypothetical protein